MSTWKTDTSATGIKRLDELLGGGFPRGACVLISGSSGVGKTILSTQYLFNGATRFDESGTYITLTEPLFKTLRNLQKFAFYDEEAVKSATVGILDMRTMAPRIGVKKGIILLENPDVILNVIEEAVRKNSSKRLVLDSITAICYALKNVDKIRAFIFGLGTVLAGLDCTTILTSEVPPRQYKYSVYGVEEFIADGVVMLDQFERKGTLIRTLQIIKMRGVGHGREKHILDISEDGIRLLPLYEEEEM